jgi:hypothetical protein
MVQNPAIPVEEQRSVSLDRRPCNSQEWKATLPFYDVVSSCFLMSERQAFCSKCGSPAVPGAAFCNRCGAPLGLGAQAAPAPASRRYEKEEKHEKHEKGEKREKGEGGMGGALVGGSVLIWLGITFYLMTIGYLGSQVWWAYFVLGIGIILLVDGLVRGLQRSRAFPGLVIGGAVLVLVGATAIQTGLQNLWPLVFVLIGALIIVGGLAGRRRSPTP